MHQTTKTYTVEEAKRKIERYCVYQERCHYDIEKKLKEMRMIPQAIDEIFGHLIQHNFLNETRFAQAFARGKFNIKNWGKVRITRELKMRKISAYNIKLALKEIEDKDYHTSFDSLAKKRLLQVEKETSITKKRKKIADYLLYRGWESAMIYDFLNEKLKY